MHITYVDSMATLLLIDYIIHTTCPLFRIIRAQLAKKSASKQQIHRRFRSISEAEYKSSLEEGEGKEEESKVDLGAAASEAGTPPASPVHRRKQSKLALIDTPPASPDIRNHRRITSKSSSVDTPPASPDPSLHRRIKSPTKGTPSGILIAHRSPSPRVDTGSLRLRLDKVAGCGVDVESREVALVVTPRAGPSAAGVAPDPYRSPREEREEVLSPAPALLTVGVVKINKVNEFKF